MYLTILTEVFTESLNIWIYIITFTPGASCQRPFINTEYKSTIDFNINIAENIFYIY